MFVDLVNKLPQYCKQQIVNNIAREWIKLANAISPTRVFNINGDMCFSNQMLNRENFEQIAIQNAVNFYTTNINYWFGDTTAFGVINKYLIKRTSKDNVFTQFNSLGILNDDFRRIIYLVLFCPKNETLQLRQMLTRIRSHWYRKLSRSPLNSGFESVLDENNNVFNIVYRPKQFQMKTDFSVLKLDDIILNQIIQTNLSDKFDIIICRSDLDNCLAAFLDDSFTLVSEKKILMKLNPLLVPFKLAITFDDKSKSTDDLSRFYEVAEHLIEMLKDYRDITIYPFVKQKLISIEGSDQLAVQYSIIIKKETFKTGILWLRNRDTQISEMVHISNFLKTILFYLQPEKLINYEECLKEQ